MGRTHVLCGMLAGAATLTVAEHVPGVQMTGPADMVGWVLVAGGAALLPDLDHPMATATRMWGPLLWPLHKAIRWLGRGHRGGSHDVVVAPVVAGMLAWLASLHPLPAAVLLTVVAGVAVRGLGLAIPQLKATSRRVATVLPYVVGVMGLLALPAGAAVARDIGLADAAGWITPVVVWMQGLSWLPWAIALGVVLHIAGDAVTKTGVPVPFTWIDGRAITNTGVLSTGRWYERWLITPTLGLATALVLALHVDPALLDHLTTITATSSAPDEPVGHR